MYGALKMRLKREVVFAVYNIAGSGILLTIMIVRYIQLNLLNTGIMLGGWDTPLYAWHAKYVIQYGPWYLMHRLSFPYLYTQLVAFLGYFTGSVVLVQKVLPIVLGMLLILLYALTTYRISNNVHIAGLAAIFAPMTVGFLHLVTGGLHRNLMAYLLALSIFLLASNLGSTISKRHYLLIFPLLFLTTAATHFETFIILSLTLVVSATIIRDWKKFAMFLSSSILALGIILLTFPDFLNRYYLKLVPQSYVLKVDWSYGDLVFWSIGSWFLLPIAVLGLSGLYQATRRKETKEISLPISVFSALLLGLSLVLIPLGCLQSSFGVIAVRAMLILPVPIILALAIERVIQFLRRLAIRTKLEGSKERILRIRGKTRAGSIIVILLTAMMFLSLTYTSIQAMNIFMGPFIQVSGYEKIIAVRQYVKNNNLEVPIFMFHGKGLWNIDHYRAYIGIEIGEHLAYYGDLDNLIDLRPTEPPFPGVEGEIAAFESSKHLRDMLGNTKYTIYPQKASVRNISDLRLRPLIFIVPELYDAPAPFYIKKFQVADGIYVVPSLAEIEAMAVPRMKLETENGITEVKGKIINATFVQVELEANSSWYKLSGYPPCFAFMKLEQGGELSYPEYDPKRFDGSNAVTGNDPAENLQYWQAYHTVPSANVGINEILKKEGKNSLYVTGIADDWGDLSIVFNPPYNVDLSGYVTLSFWGMAEQKNIVWILGLRDAAGYEVSYWNILGGQMERDSEIGHWKRLVVNLSRSTEKDPEFDFKKIDSIIIGIFVGQANKNATFYIDDLTVDQQLKIDEIYKARVAPNEKLVIYFWVKEDTQC